MSDATKDPLLDHDYDGIREYDNPLPGWWVALFWGTILFALPYTAFFHGADGRSIGDDYESEVAAFAEQLIATYGNLHADVATIRQYMDDEVAMAGMASLFRSKCAQCHRADGTGNVGPNLTDRHWINVKALPDVFQTITKGVVAKGMPSWEDQLTETQRVLLSSYVTSLARNPKKGKAPQGDEILGWPNGEGASAP